MTRPDESERLRSHVFAIAYRMTGSVTEAEDVLQEAFFRLERARHSGVIVESPEAYLAAATTRLAIDDMRSARARRESYVGTWLPEPIVTDLRESPEQMAELADSLSMAFLVLLERLSPVERAVFLLREVFDYSYEDIASIVGKSEANCRQILVRARQRIGAGDARYNASAEESEALLRSFLAAAGDGHLEQLVEMLAADAVLHGDGGGKATALPRPVYGRDRVAAVILALFEQAARRGLAIEPAFVNGGPGMLIYDAEGKIVGVLSLEVAGGLIQAIRGVVNPEKLQHLGAVSDIALLPRRGKGHRSQAQRPRGQGWPQDAGS